MGVFYAVAIGLLSSTATAPCHAQSDVPPAVAPVTLDQLLSQAQEKNPTLRLQRALIEVRRAQILSAGTVPNPTLSSENGFAEQTYHLSIEQTIELGNKRQGRLRLAKNALDIAQQEAAGQRLAILTEVRRAYVAVYLLQARKALYQTMVVLTQKLQDLAEKREKAGDMHPNDVLQAEIENLQAENALEQITVAALREQQHLNILVGLPLDTELALAPLPETLPRAGRPADAVVTVQNWIALALAHRSDIQANGLEQRQAALQTALAKAYRIPDLSLNVGPQWVSGPGGRAGVFAAGAMTLPVWNRQQGALAEAAAQAQVATAQGLALQAKVTLEVSQAWASIITSAQHLEHYHTTLLPKAHRLQIQSLQSFAAGKSEIATALLAQEAYTHTRLGYLETLGEFQNAVCDLQEAVAVLL